jgi:dCMP deaminase
MNNKWDRRFLALAEHVASWSKDPSTKTGAVIVTPDNRVVSLGFNGLPRGVEDTEERLHNRDLKYKIIVHCERNAVLLAGRPVEGCTLYTWPFSSCSTCASMMIQAGIKRHVAPPCPEDKKERWAPDLDLAISLYEEAGVRVDLLATDNKSCVGLQGL